MEIGQRIRPALRRIAATELGVPLDAVTVPAASTDASPDEGFTASSRSIEDSGMAVALAAATLRGRAALRSDIVFAAAADVARLIEVYGQLLADDLAVDPDAPLRLLDGAVPTSCEPEPELSEPAFGGHFITDIAVPGALHAARVFPPAFGAVPTAASLAALEGLSPPLDLFCEGAFVVVYAASAAGARRERRRAAAVLRWGAALPYVTSQAVHRRQHAAAGAAPADHPGAGEPGRAHAATFTRPYLAHASLSPSCAIAVFRRGHLDVTTHAQGLHPLRRDLAAALGLPLDAITVRHAPASGCYGHNGADDAAFDAALAALQRPGRTVRLQWSWADEFRWEPLGTPMQASLSCQVAEDGRITGWRHEIWSNGHSMRPGQTDEVRLLGHWLRAGLAPPDSLEHWEGGSERNARPLYDIDGPSVVVHKLDLGPPRTSTIRALGSHVNVFAIESFMEELARLAGVDPLAMRRRHLSDERALACLDRLPPMLPPLATDGTGLRRGRGFALQRYKQDGAYLALAVDAEVGGDIRVAHVRAVLDCGTVIDPRGAVAQVRGAIIQALSWTLIEEAAVAEGGVTSETWQSYPVLTFSQVPRIDVALMPGAGRLPSGVGEVATGATSAAVANAIAAATGTRLRDMPLTMDRLRAAERRDGSAVDPAGGRQGEQGRTRRVTPAGTPGRPRRTAPP